MISRDPPFSGSDDQTPSRLDETLPLQPMAEITPPSTSNGPGGTGPRAGTGSTPPGTGGVGETPKVVQYLCPFCGSVTPDQPRCDTCGGLLDPLSRQATQNSMGPWFIRDLQSPFRPGCSAETLTGLIRRKRVTLDTIVRGPSTRQFWMPARRVPGVANQLGVCHNCQRKASPGDFYCDECGADFTLDPDRQHLGLGEIRLLPGQGTPQNVAQSTRTAGLGRSRLPESFAGMRANGPADPADRDPPGARLDDTRYAIAALNGRVRTMQHGLSAALIATFAILFCGALLIVDARFNLRLGFAELLLDRDPVGVLPVGAGNEQSPDSSDHTPRVSARGTRNSATDPEAAPTTNPTPTPLLSASTDGADTPPAGIPEGAQSAPPAPRISLPPSAPATASREEAAALRAALADPATTADALDKLIQKMREAGLPGTDEQLKELLATAERRASQLRLGERQ